MAINVYDKGDIARVTGTFTNSAGAAIDPTTVTFKYRVPAGTITTLVYGTDPGLIKSAVGVYYVDISASTSGKYICRFESTGTGQAAEETEFLVEGSQLG